MCRVFKKRMGSTRKEGEQQESPTWYDNNDQVSFMPDIDSPNQQHNYPCKKELLNPIPIPPQFPQLPLLQSPKFPPSTSISVFGVNVNNNSSSNLQQSSVLTREKVHVYHHPNVDQVTDWRVLDKFVASQLSQEEVSKKNDDSNLNKQEIKSTASSCSQIDHYWKSN